MGTQAEWNAITNLNYAFFSLTWGEIAPGLVIFVLLGFGVYQAWAEKKGSKRRGYKFRQRDERKRLHLPLLITTPVTQEFSVNTFDISTSGAFLPLQDLKKSMAFTSLIGKRSGIKIGDIIDIRIFTGRFSQFSCQARVVRYNLDPNAISHTGVGIEFLNLSSRKKKALKNLIEASERKITRSDVQAS